MTTSSVGTENDPAAANSHPSNSTGETAPDPHLMHDIQTIVSRLVAKADKLIQNSTTNIAENWMQIRCKFDGGKYVNRSQSGSFQHRSSGAGLQQNLGKTWGVTMYEKMTGCPANPVFINAAESSAKRVASDRKRKSSASFKERRRQSKYSKKDDSTAARRAYSRHDGGIGPDEVVDDITPEALEEEKGKFYREDVEVTDEEARRIEEKTRAQASSDLWKKERVKRVTASHVGGISKMRKTTKRSGKVRELLYTVFTGSKATRFGTLNEEVARKEYVTKQRENGHAGLQTTACGLVIHPDTPWLAASPDGRVEDPSVAEPLGLIEIKNPYSVRFSTIKEACSSKTFCLQRKEEAGREMFTLKHKHTKYSVRCIVAVWSGVILW